MGVIVTSTTVCARSRLVVAVRDDLDRVRPALEPGAGVAVTLPLASIVTVQPGGASATSV